ncbi:MAG: succinyldiaminopimelate transaminase [Acidimicrobiales bacterium]|nr:MAG: succinyldiaminopimelate transaminase [Acidimicrobiales bacterium]
MTGAFAPPVYPYERLASARRLADSHEGGIVDLSIGTPTDPPPPAAVAALSTSGVARGYPASVGSYRYREAARDWMGRRLGTEVPVEAVAACVGTKELVASLPHLLRLRRPDRDTVLYPSLSYPTYEMGAVLAGCRPVPVPLDSSGRLDLAAVADSDAERALLVWANSPGNPAGQLEDLGAVATWGRSRDVPVASDECYADLTWDGPPRSILEHGLDGVLALHSLSKRSNLAGLRAGFYAGDPDLVRYLSETRKHAGLMVPGPVQVAAVIALDDDEHAEAQRRRYRERLERFGAILAAIGVDVAFPRGSLYLWAPVPPTGVPPAAPGPGAVPTGSSESGGVPAWVFTQWLAAEGGALVSPGDLYGPAGAGHVRIAMVAPLDRLEVVARRLGVAG